LKPVLLLIDMLVDFLDSWQHADRAQLVDAIRTALHGRKDRLDCARRCGDAVHRCETTWLLIGSGLQGA
jgi:hypothetical protein